MSPVPAASHGGDTAGLLLAARRQQAALWSSVFALAILLFGYVIFGVVPQPPFYSMGWARIGRDSLGLTLAEIAQLLTYFAASSAALLALQAFVLRPLFGGSAKHTNEATFFASSIVVRLVFLTTLAYHHYGPGGEDAPVVGDLAHRLPIVALFFAAYSTDLVQLLRRGDEFSASYPKMIVPHHWLSLAWFSAWLLLAAPRSIGGAPLWNTVSWCINQSAAVGRPGRHVEAAIRNATPLARLRHRSTTIRPNPLIATRTRYSHCTQAVLYLTCCVPVHMWKLVTCFHRPWWTPLTVLPVLCLHWLALLGSQAYFFTQCPCSALGCWYPGSVVMFAGGWGMVLYTLDTRLQSIVAGGSRALGTPITFHEMVPILLGKDPLLVNKKAPAPAPAPALASDTSSSLSAAAPTRDGDGYNGGSAVTVELILQDGRSKQQKAAGSGGTASSMRLQSGLPGTLRRRWMPACVAALLESSSFQGTDGADHQQTN